MAYRVCAERGCPRLVTTGRCLIHRKTTSERGYTTAHQQRRAAWAASVRTGRVSCRRCGELIAPGAPWDLGHPDVDCDAPLGPEHRGCNRATAGRTGGA